ncbi:MAG: TRAP transporter large permease [Akkermansiaceae bacterium]|jgi:tripartite ATP-independent transporter DctM subunit|nr:TRAP transporter large permease [Akkermansiaceae bacterium]MCU0779194.1 TRAP transporter large permease [Akkermansiaceae bacterium]
MSIGLAVLLVVFAVLLLLNTPVAIIIGVATVMAAWALGHDAVIITMAREMANGLDSYPLLAIPFFVLAGDLMGSGGLARRLIDLAASLVGRFRGGLALVNTLTCMLFGAISGSSLAAISSVGGTLIPEMNRKGYGRDFNIALTATAATTGLLIPPSNVMIVYAVVASNVSIGALFLAGVFPGILVGLLIMTTALVHCIKRGYGGSAAAIAELPKFRSALWRATPSLLLVFFVLWGILGGVFTATEASAVAVVWAFALAVICYREIPFSALPALIIGSARTTGVVLLLVAASQAMSRLLTREQVPQLVSETLLGFSADPLTILITINLILLVVGIFMDMTPAVLVFTPIFLPVATGLGMDPIHFGILMIANLCIGLCTPPVGTCLFLGCSVGNSNIARVSMAMIPFYLAMIAGLAAITAWPALSLWLPKALGAMD